MMTVQRAEGSRWDDYHRGERRPERIMIMRELQRFER